MIMLEVVFGQKKVRFTPVNTSPTHYLHFIGGGFLWEEGANSFQPSSALLQFAQDIDLLDDLILANPKLPRYVLWNKTLHPLPSSLRSFYNSKLLTLKGKARLITGLLGFIRSSPYGVEESMQEFIIRHLGTCIRTPT
jgi:protoporphyrinogen/coproporphyrinogen III oxidase